MLRLLAHLLLYASVAVVLPASARAGEVTLAWDQPAGTAPAGYRVRYRAVWSSALQERDAGRATSLKITALAAGTTYEFHVVAYDRSGRTSAPSNTVRTTIAGSLPPATAAAEPLPYEETWSPDAEAWSYDTMADVRGSATNDPASSQPHHAYLADGVHDATSRTHLAFANPTSQTAAATVYLRRDGDEHPHVASFTLPAYSHTQADPAAIAGGQPGRFSIAVTSSVPLGISRTVTWDGGSSAHVELTSATPSTRWYFAEGATHGRFALLYHLLNPGAAPATVSLSYLLPSGASMVRYYDLAAGGRRTVFVDQEAPELASTDVAVEVESLTGQPIVAERAMYLAGSDGYVGGHATVGANALRSRWLFAEGSTGPSFSTYILLANPHDRSTTADVRFHRPDGELVHTQVTVPARGRLTLDVASQDPRLSNTSLWTEVITPPDLPIVAERVMWWPGKHWQDGHAAVASSRTARRWVATGGQRHASPRQRHHVIVANASGTHQQVRLTVLGAHGSLGTTVLDVQPQRRHDVDMAALFPDLQVPYSVLVEAVGGEGQLVVEQSLYWDAHGEEWGAGAAALAQPLDD